MKKLLIYLSFLVLPLWTMAQETPIGKLFDKYSSDPDYGSIDIKANATSFAWEKDLENTELKDMLQEIDAIRILHSSKSKVNAEKFLNKVYKTYSKEAYTELATVSGIHGGSVKMYMLKGDDNMIREFSLAGMKGDNVFLLSVSGNMDMNKLLSKDMMKALGQLISMKHNCGQNTDKD